MEEDSIKLGQQMVWELRNSLAQKAIEIVEKRNTHPYITAQEKWLFVAYVRKFLRKSYFVSWSTAKLKSIWNKGISSIERCVLKLICIH